MALLLAAAMLVAQVAGDDTTVDDTTPPVLLPPREYLYQSYPGLARRLDCIIYRESRWEPGAVSVGGRYVGLAQFDYPTWLSTPPGRDGASRWDPYASIDAMAWGVVHLGYGRWPVTSRLC